MERHRSLVFGEVISLEKYVTFRAYIDFELGVVLLCFAVIDQRVRSIGVSAHKFSVSAAWSSFI